MAVAADAVGNESREVQIGVESPKAKRDRAGASSHLGRINDQDHGRIQKLRRGGRASRVVVIGEPVVETHHPLDDGDVDFTRRASKRGQQAIRRDHPGVEVAARTSGGQRVVGRVDIVGADLERLDRQPAGAGPRSSRP